MFMLIPSRIHSRFLPEIQNSLTNLFFFYEFSSISFKQLLLQFHQECLISFQQITIPTISNDRIFPLNPPIIPTQFLQRFCPTFFGNFFRKSCGILSRDLIDFCSIMIANFLKSPGVFQRSSFIKGDFKTHTSFIKDSSSFSLQIPNGIIYKKNPRHFSGDIPDLLSRLT